MRTKAELRLCLGACPRALARDCERWLKEVEPQLARVKAAVRSADGGALDGARLTIDGLPARPNEDGELEVNPGTHVIRADAAGMDPAEQEISVEKGGRTSVELALTRTPAPPPPPPALSTPEVIERSPPIAGIVVGSVGLAGLVAGGVLTLLGHLERSDLKDTCAPLCADADVEAVRRLWIAGGISAGAGAIALGVGVGLILTHGGDAKGDEEAAIRPVVHLGRGVAGLGLAGRF